MRRLNKIVSGGQTGVDQAALRAAKASGLSVGGWCPPGRVCEGGVIPSEFPLQETERERSPNAPDVSRSQRTEWNVRDSDATLVLVSSGALHSESGTEEDQGDAGTNWTVRSAAHDRRPILVCDVSDPNAKEKIRRWLSALPIRTLNVAGPSEGASPGIGERAYLLLLQVLDHISCDPTRLETESNSYSQRWFEFFHTNIAKERTTTEADFICASAPLPGFRKVLDVCCGMGRHARVLCSRGYSVTGVERDATAIARARGLAGGPNYIHADVREYEPDVSAFDVAIVMSQSFGYFDAATNRDLLRRLAMGVREDGRVILDLWNSEFFVTRQGERDLDLSNGIVRERKRLEGDRLFVHLDYPDGNHE